MVFEESRVYPMTEPQNKRESAKPDDELSEQFKPMFIIEVKIHNGLIELPVYEHQRHCPGSLIDAFAAHHNLDSESRSQLYDTLCETLQFFGD